MKKNTTLRVLSLAANLFGNGGVQSLSKVLAQNCVLLELDLSENMITMEGASYILQGLRENKVLVSVNLMENKLSDEEWEEFRDESKGRTIMPKPKKPECHFSVCLITLFAVSYTHLTLPTSDLV
eukprot:TRINITY_DN2222_c0_g1_i17.p2 TRINITY_DN2222_c0_g1~~TRINITY_DN2222_c0_g1_i17.p2  ORF type:complete len:125 (+),score=25.10 TRINITY_DN2222_c0_g1_i17:257-631(+)